MLDFSAAQLAIGVISFIVASLTGFYAWSSRKERGLRVEIDTLKDRIAVLNARVEGAATRGSQHKLSLVVAEIEGDIKGVNAQLEGIGKGMERIETVLARQEEFLLNQGRAAGRGGAS
jgi:hypothetical protein